MVEINQDRCVGCGACIADCVVHNIRLRNAKATVRQDCMKCGHCVAVCPMGAVTIPEYDMEEVEEYDAGKFRLDPDTFLRAVKFRRSVRDFEDRKIAPDKLERILQAGRYTETAVNYQDVRFILVQDRLEEVKDMIWEGWKAHAESIADQQPGMARYIIRHYDRFKEDRSQDRLFFNAPALLVIAADVPLDGGLASANVEMMAVAEGLGVMFNGYVVQALAHSETACQWLGIGTKEVASAMILGYPGISYRRTAPRRKADIIWK